MVPNNPIAALCCHQGQVADCHGLPVSAVFIAKDLIQEVCLEQPKVAKHVQASSIKHPLQHMLRMLKYHVVKQVADGRRIFPALF